MTDPFGLFDRWLHQNRRLIALTVYSFLATAAYGTAFLLRFEFAVPARQVSVFLQSLPILIAVRLLCHSFFRTSTGRWRFIGIRDVLRLSAATVSGTIVVYLVTLVVGLPVPRSVLLIELVLTPYLTAGVWIAYRATFEQMRLWRSPGRDKAKRVLIIGAGEAGVLLAREMGRFPTGYLPVGFIDDEPLKWGATIYGIEVLGGSADLPALARATGAEELIIAVPSATPDVLRRLVERCEASDLPFKVLPGIAEVLAGDVRLGQLRELRIEDLLGREPVRLELPELAADLAGKAVLITGAAGSIGRELARQVALHTPAALIVVDQAETDLFYLDRELRDAHPDLVLVPVVGDIVDERGVERVFGDCRPERVFHAAAYKHVPMMETNVREAVRNNVIGTWRVADAAGRHGAGTFVLVSTDKAVHPTSVMGATKRLAELAVIGLQSRYPSTSYAAVRFGNVLGSQGSVLPIFKRQIEAGQPLTVTDPDATRYFMTIAEAVQLILQASLLPEVRGQIAMLEMGEPVRIVDLAKNMLRLAGVSHGSGQKLVFTGLRAGEKLHEELIGPDEDTVSTSIGKVRLVEASNGLSPGIDIEDWLHLVDEAETEMIVAALIQRFPLLQQSAGEPALSRVAT